MDLNWLRDPAAATVLGLVAIFVSLWIFFRQQGRKQIRLDYFHLPIMGMHPNYVGKIQILYENKVLSYPVILHFRLQNVGSVPILAEDYETPITITFGRSAIVIEAYEVESNIGDVEVYFDQGSVEIPPFLLNPDEFVSFAVLLSGMPVRIKTSARIAGISGTIKLTRKTRAVEPVFLGVARIRAFMLVWLSILLVGINAYVFFAILNADLVLLIVLAAPIVIFVFSVLEYYYRIHRNRG